MTQFDRRLDSARIILKVGLGVGPFLAGLNKFLQLARLTEVQEAAGHMGAAAQSETAAGRTHRRRRVTS